MAQLHTLMGVSSQKYLLSFGGKNSAFIVEKPFRHYLNRTIKHISRDKWDTLALCVFSCLH